MRSDPRILGRMHFHGVGIREAVALGALAAGLAIGVAFCDPTASQNGGGARPTAATATRVPAEGLSNWQVTFLEGDNPESSVVVGQGEYPALDLSFDRAPYPDVKDDHWSLVASATFSGKEGPKILELQWAGELGLRINGQEQGISPGSGADHLLRLPFEQAASPMTFTVRLRDTGGAVRLSVRVLER